MGPRYCVEKDNKRAGKQSTEIPLDGPICFGSRLFFRFISIDCRGNGNQQIRLPLSFSLS